MKTSVVVADGSFPCITAPLQGSYAGVCRAAAQIGFDAVQLTLADPDKANADEILNETGRHGLAVSSIATGGMYAIDKLSMASPDENCRMKASDRMRRFIDLARRLGGPKVIIGTARGLASASGGPTAFERQFRRPVRGWAKVCNFR